MKELVLRVRGVEEYGTNQVRVSLGAVDKALKVEGYIYMPAGEDHPRIGSLWTLTPAPTQLPALSDAGAGGLS